LYAFCATSSLAKFGQGRVELSEDYGAAEVLQRWL